MKKKILQLLAATIVFSPLTPSFAVEIIKFDEAISGIQSFSFDGNNDGIADVIFSTKDPFGFNTLGPGPNMSYISEPGLEGSRQLSGEDLRVDFLGGAINNIQFGFAVNSTLNLNLFDLPTNDPTNFPGVKFSVYDQNNNLLNSATQNTLFTSTSFGKSSFPEAILSLNFPGVASYGIFDFESTNFVLGNNVFPERYIIDNFTGTFDAASENVAPPGSLPQTALLPDNTGNPFFNFAINAGKNGLGTEFPIYIDPDVAIAYEYTVGAGEPNVASVIIPSALPNGDSQFSLNLCGDSTVYSLIAGTTFDLASITGGLGASCFIISGINTTEMLDPTDPLAFVTGLTFINPGLTHITQTPITEFVGSGSQIPEPATLALMLSSFFGFGFTRKIKRTHNHRKLYTLANQ